MRKITPRVIGFLFILAAAFSVDGSAGAVNRGSELNAGAAARAIELSWKDYWKQVDDTRLTIQECEQISLDQAHDCLAGSIAQWEAITAIELPDGRVVAVDQSYLISLLGKTPPDLEKIDQLLAVMLAERDALGQAVLTDGNSALLSRILARPEFQWKDLNKPPSALEKLWLRIQQELSKLNQAVLGFRGSSYVIGFVAICIFILMLLFLFRHLLFGFVAEAQLSPGSRSGSELLTADSALHRAQDLSHGGDYRSAVRYLYLSALLLLEERGLLRYDRTKTNREYLQSVRGYPELEFPLRYVVEVFDRVWYGYQPLEDRDYQFYERQVGKLRQQRPTVQKKSDGA